MKRYQKLMIGTALALASIATGAYISYRQNIKSELVRPNTSQNFQYNPTLGDNLESIASKIEQEFKDEILYKKYKETSKLLEEKLLDTFFLLTRNDYDKVLDSFADNVYVLEEKIYKDKKDILPDITKYFRRCDALTTMSKEDIKRSAMSLDARNMRNASAKNEFSYDDEIITKLFESGAYVGYIVIDPKGCDKSSGFSVAYNKIGNDWKIVAVL